MVVLEVVDDGDVGQVLQELACIEFSELTEINGSRKLIYSWSSSAITTTIITRMTRRRVCGAELAANTKFQSPLKRTLSGLFVLLTTEAQRNRNKTKVFSVALCLCGGT